MEDIEDILSGNKGASDDGGIVLRVQEPRAPQVLARPKKSAENPTKDLATEDLQQLKAANVPGIEKIWTKTFGCSHNISDGEYMEGALLSYGYRFTKEKEDADLWLINSCTVKDPSQAAFSNLVRKGKDLGKGVVVSGCVPQADRNLKGLEDVSMVGITQIDKIVSVVEETLKGNSVRLLGKKQLPRLDMPKVRKDPLVEIVPLSTGCLGSCTYCKTKHARGQLGSYEPDAIVSRVQSVLEEGVQEVWLSSEDTGAYGRDIGTSLPELLRRLTSVLSDAGEAHMLRVGMTNPPFILDHLDQIAEALNHPNVYSFLHIPVQAASNKVLEAMNREYTREEFCRVADYLTKHVSGMTIATDIICGFPGETEEEFQETLDLIEKYKFPVVNISQFYPRPGTPAAKMKRVDTLVVKDRSRKMTKLFESYECNDGLLGKELDVWVGNEKSKGQLETVGHTKSYVKVLLDRNDSLIGCKVRAKIIEVSKFHVRGELIEIVARGKPAAVQATPIAAKSNEPVSEPSSCSKTSSCSETTTSSCDCDASCETKSVEQPASATPKQSDTALDNAVTQPEVGNRSVNLILWGSLLAILMAMLFQFWYTFQR